MNITMKGYVVLSMTCFILLVHSSSVVTAAGVCPNVNTRQGIVTLNNGQSACAPLVSGQDVTDEGKSFLICDNGVVLQMACPDTLRFNEISNSCEYQGSCAGPSGATAATSTGPVATATTVITTKSSVSSVSLLETLLTAATTTTTTSSTTGKSNTTSPLEPSETSPTTATSKPTDTRPAACSAGAPVPSQACDPETCRLPNCFCFGASPSMKLSEIPMFIMPTFDDDVTPSFYDAFYKDLMVNNTFRLFNPNGCTIRTALYVNDIYTDFSDLKILYESGHEIASHTIQHSLPVGDNCERDYSDMATAIDGLREIIARKTGLASIKESITGFRAPYLRVAWDTMFEVLRDYKFVYDSSITNIEITANRKPVWPYTLDYLVPQCPNRPCPTKSYPGLWEVPINGWVGNDGFPCSLIDGCTVGNSVFTATEEEYYSFYKDNFDKYFYKDKIPMHMFTHCAMFLRSPPSHPALVSFYRDVLANYSDVWIVTPQQVIQWMQNPLTNSQMKATKWGC